jgi:hypothetical protein
MDTIAQGNAAEAAVLHALTLAGVQVLVPFGDGLSFDLGAVVPGADEILRIQVKSGRFRNGCVLFNTCGSDHGTGRKDYRDRADFIAVWVRQTDSVYVIPVDECPGYVCTLRLEPPRNNQRLRIRLARDYTVAAWVGSSATRATTPGVTVIDTLNDATEPAARIPPTALRA